MTDRHVLNVAVDRPYDVVVGRSLLDDVVNALPGAERIAIIHPAALSPTANAIADAFKSDARFTITIETPDAERSHHHVGAHGFVGGRRPTETRRFRAGT